MRNPLWVRIECLGAFGGVTENGNRSLKPWNQRGRFNMARRILTIERAFPVPSQGPEPDILFRQETKADIAATNANIETLRQETKADIAATNANIETLRQETKADIAATNANIETLRLETKANIETLRQETEKLIALGKNDIIKWVVGANIGIAALIVAAIKLL